MKRWIADHFPGECSGRAGREQRIVIALALAFGLLWMAATSTAFLSRYRNQSPDENIYHEVDTFWNGRWTTTREPVKIASLNSLMEGVFRLLPLQVLLAAVLAGMNYLSFYYPTRSIYVMKRLRSRWELHRRCLAFPVSWILVCVAVCVILGSIYCHMYFHNTVPGRIPDGVSLNIWRTLAW